MRLGARGTTLLLARLEVIGLDDSSLEQLYFYEKADGVFVNQCVVFFL